MNRLFILTTFGLLSILFSLKNSDVLAAQLSFGPNLLVSDAISGFDSSGDGLPIIDIDIAKSIYVAWIDHRSFKTEVFFSKLTSDGNTFTANKALTEINDQKSFPQIEEDQGNIYIAWNERRIVNGVTKQGIFFTKSTDGGITFAEETLIAVSDLLPFTMVAHDGKIVIAYSIQIPFGLTDSYGEIWVAYSSKDYGNSFTKTKVTDGRYIRSIPQRPAIDFVGNNLYVFWLDNREGRFKVFFAKSQDNGVSFSQNRSIFDHPNSAIHLLGNTFGRLSSKVSSSGDIFIAFDFYLQTSNPFTSDFEAYFMKSSDRGNTFSSAQRLADDLPTDRKSQQSPSLTLLPDGSPVISWNDCNGGCGQVKLSYSQDQGETFSPNIRINNTARNSAFGQSIVADREGKMHFVRLDGSLSPVGIWYTKIDLGVDFEVAPIPFLDLPWDYQGKGLSFTEAALNINSYFGHEYPLLSANLIEPINKLNQITTFQGENSTSKKYSSHDGYDYGKDAKANIGDSVLAAASGCASYLKTGAGGNVIKIDHGNGYQTRYLHLQDDGLVTKSSSCIQVLKGQQIGKVGATGNVIPPGELGAHIHFMVIRDKNNDGNFDDNIPDGVTDPFGWQSTEEDPWSPFAFSYGGQARTGNKSFYLWTKQISNLSGQLTSNGGFFELEKFKLNFPQGATNQNLTLDVKSAPNVKQSNILESIGSTLVVTAKDAFDNLVETFQGLFTVTVDFSSTDISSYDPGSIAIYSSEDGVNWTKEETTVVFVTKTASAQLNHLTHFALMAERMDTTAPTTTTTLIGSQGQTNWFRSGVQVILDAKDNEGGLGVEYTLYKINDQDWQEYLSPITFAEEGIYKVEFYSVDNDENIEEIKNVEFNIDKTPPQASIDANSKLLWPPNGKMVDVTVTGESVDTNLYSTSFSVEDEYDLVEPTISDFGQIIQLEAKRDGSDLDGRAYIIKVVAEDLAGNKTEKQVMVLIPHDQGQGKK